MRLINEIDPKERTPEIQEIRSRVVLTRYDNRIRLSYCEYDSGSQKIRWYESTTNQLMGIAPDGWSELPISED